MSCDFATVVPESPVYRLARMPDPWAWPDWSQAAPGGTFGNRWDDPAGVFRVLYASSSRFGALIETLARFRPDLEVLAELEAIRGHGAPIPAGTVPREWFANRVMGAAQLHGAYVDIGAAKSLAALRSRLAARAIHYGIPEIDAAAIRLVSPRAFTQEVSRLVYECRPESVGSFAGIRYASRLDDATLNWAVFEPGPGEPLPFTPLRAQPLHPKEPDVQRALSVLGLGLA